MLYYILNVILLFPFLSFKFTQTNSKPCNIFSRSPDVIQIYPARTSPLTWSNASFRSHRAHSSGVSVHHPFSCHTWGPLTAPEQSCLTPNYFTSPDRFRKLKTSFHDIPNKRKYSLGGLVKYLHRHLLLQYWENRPDNAAQYWDIRQSPITTDKH